MFRRVASTLFSPSSSSGDLQSTTEQAHVEAIEAAKTAAYATSPRTYILETPPLGQKINFLVFGCQGNAKEEQKRTAALMNQMAKEVKADFYIVLGDNFYDEGVATPDDPAFDSHFYQIYANPLTVPHLASLPGFVIQGNHDQGRWKTGEYKQQILSTAGLSSTRLKGVDLGMNQVAHTYYGNASAKVALYQASPLKLNKLPPWNMPSRYYSLICGNLEIFMIDSNTYASDYLKYIKDDDITNDNQARWLKERMADATAASRTVMLALHHPLFTPGKRAYNSDISLYLNEQEINEITSQFSTLFSNPVITPPYNRLLREIFKRQAFVFDTVFAAHDHSLSYFNNSETCTQPEDYLCQIISAGGGGHLQERISFEQQENMGCFLKKHGAVNVTFNPQNPNDIRFLFETINQEGRLEYKINFSSRHCKPIVQHPTDRTEKETKRITQFISVVKSAIDDYCQFYNDRQTTHRGAFFTSNLTHGQDGVDRANDLWAYLYDIRTGKETLATMVEKVHLMTERKSYFAAADHSLITLLNKKMGEEYQQTIQEMHEELQQLARSGRINIASP